MNTFIFSRGTQHMSVW